MNHDPVRWSSTVAELVRYSCPKCNRTYTEMRGPLMSDMGSERAAKREQRRLFMRGLRDRLRGIERDPPRATDEDDEWPAYSYQVDENIRCRRCGLRMEPTRLALVD